MEGRSTIDPCLGYEQLLRPIRYWATEIHRLLLVSSFILTVPMIRKVLLWVIGLSFVGYTIWLVPLDRAYTWQVAPKLVTFQFGAVNSYLMAIFWLMGVWPMIYACLLFVDGRMQNFRAWPYFIGANFTGVLCLIPYFLLHQRNQEFEGKKDQWLELLDRRSTGFMLLGITVILISYAFLTGEL